uniref:Uncharacterized protein n=1 Tax=Physcomitrium patens TaxID=3218 RepID=A0A2K1K850_PHYPA|nr:hypothetical protein PHYPA_011849 [Physcomitrium patens]
MWSCEPSFAEGFSHEIQLQDTSAVCVFFSFFCSKPNLTCCTGIDHQKVIQFAAIIKS